MGINNQLYLGLLSLHNQMKEEVQQNNTTKKVEVKLVKKIPNVAKSKSKQNKIQHQKKNNIQTAKKKLKRDKKKKIKTDRMSKQRGKDNLSEREKFNLLFWYRKRYGMRPLMKNELILGLVACYEITVKEIYENKFDHKRKMVFLSLFDFHELDLSEKNKLRLELDFQKYIHNVEQSKLIEQKSNFFRNKEIIIDRDEKLSKFRKICGFTDEKYFLQLEYGEKYKQTMNKLIRHKYPKEIIQYFETEFKAANRDIDVNKVLSIFSKYQLKNTQHNYTLDLVKQRISCLVRFREICWLPAVTISPLQDDFEEWYFNTAEEIENADYPDELLDLFLQVFSDPFPNLNINLIQSIMNKGLKEPQKNVEKKIIFKHLIINGFVESIPIEVADNLNVETMQYDYYNNDNNMYDNLDYRDLQDQFDLLGVTKNNWD